MDVLVAKRPRRMRYLIGAAGVLALAGIGVVLTGLGAAAPRIARSATWIGRVERGDLVVEVNAAGTLVSDEVRFITARVAGLVEQAHVKAGAVVDQGALLITLSNPDLEVAALEAATAVKEAEAQLLDLRASLGMQRIEQRSGLETLRAQYQDARRRSEASTQLAEHKAVAALDFEQLREHAGELAERVRLQQQHTRALGAASHARLTAQRAKVDGLSAQASLRASLVDGLQVRAPTRGLLAQLDVEAGRQVSAGVVLGKIIDPRKLKAELRVPEARARDVTAGQRVQLTIQTESVSGHVTRVDPTVQQGNVRVEVAFDHDAPATARLDLSVDGRIELDRVRDVLFIDKPAKAGGAGTISLFKLLDDGQTAQRVPVRLGKSSATAIEVQSGLRSGDRVILSDMSDWSSADRIELD
jgi:HlyD family secretion protein